MCAYICVYITYTCNSVTNDIYTYLLHIYSAFFIYYEQDMLHVPRV